MIEISAWSDSRKFCPNERNGTRRKMLRILFIIFETLSKDNDKSWSCPYARKVERPDKSCLKVDVEEIYQYGAGFVELLQVQDYRSASDQGFTHRSIHRTHNVVQPALSWVPQWAAVVYASYRHAHPRAVSKNYWWTERHANLVDVLLPGWALFASKVYGDGRICFVPWYLYIDLNKRALSQGRHRPKNSSLGVGSSYHFHRWHNSGVLWIVPFGWISREGSRRDFQNRGVEKENEIAYASCRVSIPGRKAEWTRDPWSLPTCKKVGRRWRSAENCSDLRFWKRFAAVTGKWEILTLSKRCRRALPHKKRVTQPLLENVA